MRDFRSRTLVLAVVLVVAQVSISAVRADAPRSDTPIDWPYAQTLYQRWQHHEPLTPQEQTYLDRAKAAHAQGQGPGGPSAGNVPSGRPATGLAPLDQMAAADKYKGEDGGLYGGGRNVPTGELAKAAARESAKIVPLDGAGRPAADGKIVLAAIGMSNTTQEFSRFKELAESDADRNPKLVIVDGAQGGKDAAAWLPTGSNSPWLVLDQRLKMAGVTPQQVEVLWLKQALIQPARFGDFPKHADELKKDIVSILTTAKGKFPNLRVVYLSSRIYAGFASTVLNPEPYAYESAFAVRWVIRDQAKGEAKPPVLLWGPYLWADGLTPRKSDGLTWRREDLGPDGTHPSGMSGRQKVAELLLKFFKNDVNAKQWFLATPSVKP